MTVGARAGSLPYTSGGLVMPDLRTVLTETQRSEIRDAISAHRLWNGRCEACGAVSRRESDHMADVVIETLAGLPGVAVTQLPEAQADPEYGDPYWPVELEGETYPGKLRIDYGYRSGPRIALIGIPTPLRVADVPNLTAALLSAAAAVVLSEGEAR